MEELLNKLIEKGWKPFGRNYCKYEKWCLYYTVHTEDGVWSEWRYWVSLRELVSKESWLWQFVCENGMVEEESFQYIEDKEICTSDEWTCYYNDDWYPRDNFYTLDRTDTKFWIIESALIDESKLESFILDNIEV